MELNLSGGFTPLRAIEEEEKNLFEQVITNIPGNQYAPLAVATQVVNGTNLAFLCLTGAFHPDTEKYNTLVIIHKPLPNVVEEPCILEIRVVKII